MITLSEGFSKINGIGVELFELINKVDANTISLSFRNDKVKVRIDKKKDWSSNLTSILIGIVNLENKYKKGRNS